jgi:hypothetical protein
VKLAIDADGGRGSHLDRQGEIRLGAPDWFVFEAEAIPQRSPE